MDNKRKLYLLENLYHINNSCEYDTVYEDLGTSEQKIFKDVSFSINYITPKKKNIKVVNNQHYEWSENIEEELNELIEMNLVHLSDNPTNNEHYSLTDLGKSEIGILKREITLDKID